MNLLNSILNFKTLLYYTFLITLSVALTLSHGKLYSKLIWKPSPLCSDSVKKSLAFNKTGDNNFFANPKKYILECGVRCQLSNGSCSAFQVNVGSSASVVGKYDVSCSHFMGLPDGLSKSLQNNCFLLSAVENQAIYMNIASWGGNDISPYSIEANELNTVNMEHACQLGINRGANFYRLDMQKMMLYDFCNFDLYGNLTHVTMMTNYLKNTPLGTVVVGQTCDEPHNLISYAVPYLKSVNLDVSSMLWRGKWLFVWQQGAYQKAISFVDNSNLPLSKQFVIYNSASNQFDWTGVKMQALN
ncbi:hypothetical protein HELRODRAFT_167609 [Helobdella robusta]|uniref:ILEI/PANDER domain-containing protein n=1 Tax=Helobdella robusta TaxID=6412 RepID=T1EZJ8_HELRO|nr:hypothetical protein HELRODRAFT_167609 [Helobdella robusta]ESO11077.1 hypothetical protein HELRODRAFT_167609 [Helobdella robusta]